jgi:hypothetical protein
MKRIARALILVLLAGPVAGAQAPTAAPPPGPDEAGRWRAVARAVTLCTKVKIETVARKRYTGTLMEVTDEAIVIKRSTRLPEPPVTVPFDQVSRIEQDHGGMSVGKAWGLGAAVAGGAILTVFLIVLARTD